MASPKVSWKVALAGECMMARPFAVHDRRAFDHGEPFRIRGHQPHAVFFHFPKHTRDGPARAFLFIRREGDPADQRRPRNDPCPAQL